MPWTDISYTTSVLLDLLSVYKLYWPLNKDIDFTAKNNQHIETV